AWRRKLFFFFSSRRRHTRLVSDWSSDVCSSDLNWQGESRHRPDILNPVASDEGDVALLEERGKRPVVPGEIAEWAHLLASRPSRSEERRVGKKRKQRGGE